MVDLIPDDEKEKLAEVIDKDNKGWESALEEIRFKICQKDYKTALKLIEALEKAMRWNPSFASIAFEHAENYKVLGNLDEFEKCTKNIFKIAFRPKDLARCYRNLGYLYVEKQNYDLATCCEAFSLQFEKSNMVQAELYYISTKTGKVFEPSIDEIKGFFEINDIPFGPDEDVIGLAYTYGKHIFDEKNCRNYIDVKWDRA